MKDLLTNHGIIAGACHSSTACVRTRTLPGRAWQVIKHTHILTGISCVLYKVSPAQVRSESTHFGAEQAIHFEERGKESLSVTQRCWNWKIWVDGEIHLSESALS